MSSRSSGARFGRYVLGARLGAGGMGEVYLAVQTSIGHFEKPLALKLLLPHLSRHERAVAMFLDEARLAARMSHPHVTSIFDVGVVDGRYFIAMELVRGVSVARLIDALRARGERPDVELVAAVGAALCEGLHHAHEQRDGDGRPLGLVHRDVTPHNVLVSSDGLVKLADFGIARAHCSVDERDRRRLVGKLAYVAPEQVRGAPVDRRADLYAAGLTLLHFATLRQPVDRGAPEPTLRAIDHGCAREAVADAPEALRAALATALAVEPAARPPDALALRALLPPVAPDAAARLGALVEASCGEALRSLTAHTNHAIGLGRETASVGRPGAEADEADEASIARHARRAARRSTPRSNAELDTNSSGQAHTVRLTSSWRRPVLLPALLVLLAVAAGAAAVIVREAPSRLSSSPATEPAATGAARAGAELNAGGTSAGRAAGAGTDASSARATHATHASSAASAGNAASAASAANSAGAGSVARAGSAASAGTAMPSAELLRGASPGAARSGSDGALAAGAPVTRLAGVGAARTSAAPGASPRPTPTSPVAYVTVDAEPWAHVYANGRLLGETPLASVAVPSGQLTLVLANPETGRRRAHSLTLSPGQRVALRESLR